VFNLSHKSFATYYFYIQTEVKKKKKKGLVEQLTTLIPLQFARSFSGSVVLYFERVALGVGLFTVRLVQGIDNCLFVC
jgi:hypothetical protein